MWFTVDRTEKKGCRGPNGGVTAHFWFLVSTQQVVSQQEGHGARRLGARPSRRAYDSGETRARHGF